VQRITARLSTVLESLKAIDNMVADSASIVPASRGNSATQNPIHVH
jgi:hypothetical protein